MKYSLKSHQNGDSKLPKPLQNEIEKAIQGIRTHPGKKKAAQLRKDFLAELWELGWSDKVNVSKGSSKMTVTSKKQKTGLCLQTGNMGRMYADLMKLQTLYYDNLIKSAAIVIPSQAVAKLLGSNIANADRLLRELEVFVKVYSVPTVIFSLE